MIPYKKIGVLFVAVGLTLTGQYLVNTGSQRLRADDIAVVAGAAIEREIPYLAAGQKYMTPTNAGNDEYTIDSRPVFSRVWASLRSLRSRMSEGGALTPFEVVKGGPWFNHGSAILTNLFDVSGTFAGHMALPSTPRGIPDALSDGGRVARFCACELVNSSEPVNAPWGLADIDGSRSRWQIISGLSSGRYQAELFGDPERFSVRILGGDISAAEKAITNSSARFFFPNVPLEILGGYSTSGSSGRDRHSGRRMAAISAARGNFAETARKTITARDQIPAICEASIYAHEMFRDDWKTEIWADNLFTVTARPVWPCRQAVEAGLVSAVETYIVYAVSWQFESYDDTPRKIPTNYIDGHANAQLGLADNLLRSPITKIGQMVAPPYSSPELPQVYIACKVARSLSPRTWPLPAFTIDFTSFRAPDQFPGNPQGSGQLRAFVRIYGIFSVANFIFAHRI